MWKKWSRKIDFRQDVITTVSLRHDRVLTMDDHINLYRVRKAVMQHEWLQIGDRQNCLWNLNFVAFHCFVETHINQNRFSLEAYADFELRLKGVIRTRDLKLWGFSFFLWIVEKNKSEISWPITQGGQVAFEYSPCTSIFINHKISDFQRKAQLQNENYTAGKVSTKNPVFVYH